MRSIRFLAAALLLGLATACTTPQVPIPIPGVTSPYYGELQPSTCEGPVSCAGTGFGVMMNSCTVFGGPISVTLTSYNDPWDTGITIQASAIETEGLYGDSLGLIGNGEFTYVGQTLSTPDLAPGTCFLVRVHATTATCIEPGTLNCLSGRPGGKFRVEW